MSKKRATGWTTLWPWVIGAFVLLVGAWSWLIVTSAENAPVQIELKEVK